MAAQKMDGTSPAAVSAGATPRRYSEKIPASVTAQKVDEASPAAVDTGMPSERR
jgi:hypothetical protein